MIEQEALFTSRERWERKASSLFSAVFDEERQAVLISGSSGFDQLRWFAALFTLWNGVADDWIPVVREALPGPKGEVLDAGLGQDLIGMLAGKAAGIVELSEEEWLLLGDEALTAADFRIEALARNESVQAHAWSQAQTARAQPLRLFKIWQAVLDDRTRPSHRTANEQQRLIDDPFDVGGAALQWPADAGGPVGEIINCRCWEDYELR